MGRGGQGGQASARAVSMGQTEVKILSKTDFEIKYTFAFEFVSPYTVY